MEVIRSRKGGSLIIDNGFIFKKHREKETATYGRRLYWRCCELNCKATLTTDPEFNYQGRGNEHTHEGDPLKAERARAIHTMKRRAIDTVETTSQIVTRARTTVPESVLISLPNTDALSKAVQRIRRKERGIEHDHDDNFEIPQHLKFLERINERFEREQVSFLLFDSFDEPAIVPDAASDDEFVDALEDLEDGMEESGLNEVINGHAGAVYNESMANLTDDEEAAEIEQEGDDPQPKPPRIIIFGTNEGLIQLRSSYHWFGDGTFDVCPASFNQLFTLHARYLDTKVTFPCMYILLKRKDAATFQRMFAAVKSLVGEEHVPASYLCDFEKAQMIGFEQNYPSTNITGCLFHLAQSVQRNCQKRGLKQTLETDNVLNLQVKCIRAMAFVPAGDIVDVWRELAPTLDRRLREVTAYFERTYVGTGARLPLFDPRRWSVYERTLNNDARSNNSVEAYHGALKRFFNSSNPSPLVCVDNLRHYHQKVLADLCQMRINQLPRSKQRPQWLENDLRKRRIALTYHNVLNKIQYVKDVAATFI